MKINICNPPNQKPHVFSSWRVLFRVERVGAPLCALDNYSRSECRGDAHVVEGAGGAWCAARAPWDDTAWVGSQPSHGLDVTLASFLTS